MMTRDTGAPTNNLDVEVLVVGAGPAGTAAAIQAQRHGLGVLVLDKARFPRDKTCGDGLTTSALRHLATLGLDLGALRTYQPVRDILLVGPDGREIELRLPDGGQHAGVVPRLELDAALVALTRSNGIEISEGRTLASVAMDNHCATAVLDDGTRVHARFIVAADGHFSSVRRSLASSALDNAPTVPGTWHAFRQYFSGVEERRLSVLFERDLLPGYAWIFPLPDGRANVGLGVLRSPATTGKGLASLWRELLERDSIRKVLGTTAEPIGRHRAWPIPTNFHPDRLSSGRALFVGDAAGVVDPMTGEGIGQALETGMLAADSIAQHRSSTDDHPRAVATTYRHRVERALGRDLRLATRLQQLNGSRLALTATLRAVDANSWTRKNFARWLFEDYPRAVLLTPSRWRRHTRQRPPPYGSYNGPS